MSFPMSRKKYDTLEPHLQASDYETIGQRRFCCAARGAASRWNQPRDWRDACQATASPVACEAPTSAIHSWIFANPGSATPCQASQVYLRVGLPTGEGSPEEFLP
jgi:hypothetical protein